MRLMASRRAIGRALAVAAAALAAATAMAVTAHADRQPTLTAAIARVEAGGTLVLHGRGFPPDAHVTLRAGLPQAKTVRIGGAHTGRRGGFVARIAIHERAAAGRYVAMACHDRCRIKASTSFRVLRP